MAHAAQSDRIHESNKSHTNLQFEEIEDIEITDIRGAEPDFSLDTHGFELTCEPDWLGTRFQEFDSVAKIQELYLPACEALIKNRCNARKALAFDWRIRRSSNPSKLYHVRKSGPAGTLDPLTPSTTVHIDHSPAEVIRRARSVLGSEADMFLKTGRVRVINVWRPLYDPVVDRPLCLCDGSTVKSSDLIKVDVIMGDIERQVINVLHQQDQRWYYLSQQRPDELWLLKTFDTDRKVKAKCESIPVYTFGTYPGVDRNHRLSTHVISSRTKSYWCRGTQKH